MFRPLTVEDTIDVFSVLDTAIDWDAMSKAEEEKLRFEITAVDGAAWKTVKVKAGDQLCRFRLGVIKPDAVARIHDLASGTEERLFLYFAESLIDVIDWPGEKTMLGQKVSREWIDKTFVRELRRVAISIGHSAFAFNSFSEIERKNWAGRLRRESATIALPATNATTSSSASADASAPAAA